MIKTCDGQTLTPRQAAKMILSQALDNGATDWFANTHIGQDLDFVITQRERRSINDQVHKIFGRIERRYLRP